MLHFSSVCDPERGGFQQAWHEGVWKCCYCKQPYTPHDDGPGGQYRITGVVLGDAGRTDLPMEVRQDPGTNLARTLDPRVEVSRHRATEFFCPKPKKCYQSFKSKTSGAGLRAQALCPLTPDLDLNPILCVLTWT